MQTHHTLNARMVFLLVGRLNTIVITYLNIGTQSTFAGLTTAQIKAHLNITDSGQDTYIAALLQAAVVYVERRLQLDIRQTTWTLYADEFPYYAYDSESYYGQRLQEIDLLRGPVRSITSIYYYDAENTYTLLGSGEYILSSPSYFTGKVYPVLCWPITPYCRPDAIQISFTTGMDGTGSGSGSGDDIPVSILHAIKLICGQWYAARENIAYGPGTAMGVTGCAVDSLLDQFAVQTIG